MEWVVGIAALYGGYSFCKNWIFGSGSFGEKKMRTLSDLVKMKKNLTSDRTLASLGNDPDTKKIKDIDELLLDIDTCINAVSMLNDTDDMTVKNEKAAIIRELSNGIVAKATKLS